MQTGEKLYHRSSCILS